MTVAHSPMWLMSPPASASRVRKAGLSIEDLSVRTKIKPSILLSIEQGAFEQIPGGEFFTRAFLRTYAREVHVPTAEIMGDYDSTRPGPVVVEAPPASRHHRLDSLRSAGVGWSLAVVIVAALLVRFAATRPAPTPDVERQSRGNDGKRRPGRAGRSRRHHWISSARTPHRGDPPHPPALGDRQRRWQAGVVPHGCGGEEITLRGRERMAFTLGDAGAFEYAINGVPGKRAGRDGEVRELVIDRSNYRELAR